MRPLRHSKVVVVVAAPVAVAAGVSAVLACVENVTARVIVVVAAAVVGTAGVSVVLARHRKSCSSDVCSSCRCCCCLGDVTTRVVVVMAAPVSVAAGAGVCRLRQLGCLLCTALR